MLKYFYTIHLINSKVIAKDILVTTSYFLNLIFIKYYCTSRNIMPIKGINRIY